MKTQNPLRQVALTLSVFSDDVPTFDSHEAQLEFQAALGRMVLYAVNGIQDAECDDVAPVHMSISNGEITAAYSAPLPAAEIGDDGIARYYKGAQGTLDECSDKLYQSSLRIRRPFVMAAVKGWDGKYGFHS